METGVALGKVNKMIKKLNYWRICSKWVPKLFINEIKVPRKEAMQQLPACYYQESELFLKNIVAGDESWISHYDPQLIQQSTEYRHPSSPHYKKFQTETANQKVMLTGF